MILTITPKKMSLYLANGRKSAAQVMAETGADIVINGTLYTFSTMKPCLDFKADGVVYSDEEPLYEGYGWNNNDYYMVRTTNMAKYDNFISSCNLIKQEKECSVDGIAWVAGARPRTAIGWKANGKMIIYVTNHNETVATVTKNLREAGCVDAINLDGGGSTQISTRNYGSIYSPEGRKVQNYLCIWEDTPQQAPSSPNTSKPASYWNTTPTNASGFPLKIRGTTNLNVRQSATSSSPLVRVIPMGTEFAALGYANLLNKSWLKISDGYVYRAYTQCENPYKEPTVNVRKGNYGDAVRWIQWWLGKKMYKGMDGKVLGCDGSFGPNTEYALKIFQKDHGLTIDGICGVATRGKLKET